MQGQQEIGGAQALLLLGTSDSKAGNTDIPYIESTDKTVRPERTHCEGVENKEENCDAAKEIHAKLESPDVNYSGDENPEINPRVHGANVNDNPEVNELMDKANQLLNDAVEAAVMRYVGGTLDTGEDIDGSGPAHSDTDVHDDGDISRKRTRLNPEDLLSEYQWDKFLEEEVAAGFERASPKKKQRKGFGTDHEIDPDLDGLEGHSEHDQLVHAAILGAGELAKQLTLSTSSHQRLAHQMSINQERRAVTPPEESDSVAINHLAHAAKAISSGYKANRRPISHETKRPLKKQSVPTLNHSEQSLAAESKYDYSSLETLVEQASSEACLWYNTQSDIGDRGPRPFSPEEINIVEHFLRGYCRLNHLNRMDICRRVWTSERPKDNFWESVTKVLPYRSKASVYKHIRRQYHVFQVRAKWTTAEDDLLRKLTETTTSNWKDIGEAMNRMPEDCRDRWRNYIKCGANRVMNKWSEEEEQSLKNIVMEMITSESQTDKPILINWTIVSERMNGVRSRIQCRYKWNKLLRRESLSRISMMDSSIKLWILNRILESNVTEPDSIDWDYIVHMYHEIHKEKNKILWTTADFKVAFEKMRGTVKDSKNLPLHTIVTKLIDSIYQATAHEEIPTSRNMHSAPKPITTYEELRPKPYDQTRSAEHEAALVANAAVAAVSSTVSMQDAQHQEYSLWR